MSTHFLRISRNRSQKSSHSERKSSCLLIIFTFFLCSSLLFSYRKNPRTAPQPFHLSLPPGDKLRHGLHRPGLLFLRRDSRRRVPLLGAVIAELGMVAALDLHHVLGVVDLVLHALVQGAVDGEGVLRRVVAVEIGPQQDKAVDLVRKRTGRPWPRPGSGRRCTSAGCPETAPSRPPPRPHRRWPDGRASPPGRR